MATSVRMCPRCGSLVPGAFCPIDGAATAPHDVVYRRHLAPGTVLFGRFVVGAFVEDDGSMAIHEGRDEKFHLPTRIAVIPVPGHARPADLLRMREAAHALEALEHPGIARVLASGTTDEGDLAIVGAHVEGRSLAEILRDGPLGIERTVELGIGLFTALEAAHAHGVSHHALGPSRIRIGPEGEVVVTDLGLQDLLHPPNLETSLHASLARDARYRAPEVVRDRAVTRHADIYSAGAILFEALKGRPASAQSDAAPADRALDAPVEESLAHFLTRCLEPRPWHRFDTAALAKTALEAVRQRIELAGIDGQPRTVDFVWAPPLPAEATDRGARPARQAGSGLLVTRRAKRSARSSAAVEIPLEPPIARAASHARRRRGAWAWLGVALLGIVVAGFALVRSASDVSPVEGRVAFEREPAAKVEVPKVTGGPAARVAAPGEAHALEKGRAEGAAIARAADVVASAAAQAVVRAATEAVAKAETEAEAVARAATEALAKVDMVRADAKSRAEESKAEAEVRQGSVAAPRVAARAPAPVAAPPVPAEAPAPSEVAPQMLRALLITEPPGAAVIVDGRVIGTSPMTLRWPSGQVPDVQIRMVGFEVAPLPLRDEQHGKLLRMELLPIEAAPPVQ